jgi:lysophospholipase L1-like esterase
MTLRTYAVPFTFLTLLLAACDSEPAGTGGSSTAGSSAEAGSSAGGNRPDEGGAPSEGGAATISGGSASGGAPAEGGAPSAGGAGAGGSPPSPGLATLGSLVVLGDSIGDGGGQSPFYYNLLRDALTDHYGPLDYRRKAQSGSKTGALAGQIDDLPSTLPGPVAVVITSGGNDMKAALPLILAGSDDAARATMQANLEGAYLELTSPGRFGDGVEVHVFQATIYDASDGVGDFGEHDCAFAGNLPTIPSAGFFAEWNGTIEAAVGAHGQTVADVHGLFSGHGYSGNPNWFASDCTHPNTLGHAALAEHFESLIVGAP